MEQSHRHKSCHRFLGNSVLNGKKGKVGEIKEKTQATIIKEFSADGTMIQYNSIGEFKGKYHSTNMETVDVKVKMDGTNELDSSAMEMTKEGDVIMIWGKG